MAAKREFKANEVRSIVATYEKGYGLEFLAEKYGVGTGPIRQVLVDNDVAIRGRGRPSAETVKARGRLRSGPGGPPARQPAEATA